MKTLTPPSCTVELCGGDIRDGQILDVLQSTVASGVLMFPMPASDTSAIIGLEPEPFLNMLVARYDWDGTVNDEGHYRFRFVGVTR